MGITGVIIVYLIIGVILFYAQYVESKKDFDKKHKDIMKNKSFKSRINISLVYEVKDKKYRLDIDLEKVFYIIFCWPAILIDK